MITASLAVLIARRRAGKLGESVYSGRAWRLVERNFLTFTTSRIIELLSGFVEPVFYMASFGLGVGQLVGKMSLDGGPEVSYGAFLAPALLATSAMNGAIISSAWNVFFKMQYGKYYQAWLGTSMGTLDVVLGEILFAIIRGLAYSLAFILIVGLMGFIPSIIGGVLAILAAALVAFGFASVGMSLVTFFTDYHQMNWLNHAMLPMFLFSGAFYGTSYYPQWVQVIVNALPLNQAVYLERTIMLGQMNWHTLGSAAYFVAMAAIGLTVTTRRMTAMFQR